VPFKTIVSRASLECKQSAPYTYFVGQNDEELLRKRNHLMSRDIDQIAAIRGYGVDLDKKRQIDLTFWAPTENAAKVFVVACKRNEMPPQMVLDPAASEANQRWLIRCSITASVTFMTTEENLATFLLFADKYDCEYDGWGTAIVEAAGPMTPVQ
jgi:Regulator of ribonuclease activity B